MRYVVSCGGTGGHINPGLSIAAVIKKHEPDAQILFIGAPYGMEKKLVPAKGYDIRYVKVRGFSRSLRLSNIDALIKSVTSVFAAKRIIREFKPDAVIGTGGYASWAALRAAASLGLPTVIHEQNAFPGVTTKMLSKHVDQVCISFEESRRFFDDSVSNKLVFTGNPVNTEAFSVSRERARRELGIGEDTVYILSAGGSLGADMVNSFCLDMMKSFVSSLPFDLKWRQTHATGAAGREKYFARAAELGLDKCENIEIVEYIYDMPLRMAAADIVISRAGAITLSELAFLGRAAVLIPSPNVAEDHQYRNAKVLADAGAAVVLRESECNAEKLAGTVRGLVTDVSARAALARNIRKFAAPGADERIYERIRLSVENARK